MFIVVYVNNITPPIKNIVVNAVMLLLRISMSIAVNVKNRNLSRSHMKVVMPLKSFTNKRRAINVNAIVQKINLIAVNVE